MVWKLKEKMHFYPMRGFFDEVNKGYVGAIGIKEDNSLERRILLERQSSYRDIEEAIEEAISNQQLRAKNFLKNLNENSSREGLYSFHLSPSSIYNTEGYTLLLNDERGLVRQITSTITKEGKGHVSMFPYPHHSPRTTFEDFLAIASYAPLSLPRIGSDLEKTLPEYLEEINRLSIFFSIEKISYEETFPEINWNEISRNIGRVFCRKFTDAIEKRMQHQKNKSFSSEQIQRLDEIIHSLRNL